MLTMPSDFAPSIAIANEAAGGAVELWVGDAHSGHPELQPPDIC
jgi:hypothetical protein